MSETNYPIHLLNAYQQFYTNVIPDWVLKAPDYEVWAAASRLDAPAFNLVNATLGVKTSFSWQTAKVKQTLLKRPLPRWARYPAGVVFHLCADGLDRSGVYMAVYSTESAPLRAEYGLGMAVATLWYTINGQSFTVDSVRDVVEQVRREYILEG